jgi:hypothetical protein
LGRKHIDVVELRKLFRRKGFGRAERHVAGIVDHHVEAPVVGDDFRDTGVGGLVGADVELDGPEIDTVLLGVARGLGDLRRVATRGLAHAGVDDMAGVSQCTRGERAEAAGSAGDDDNLFHDTYPS